MVNNVSFGGRGRGRGRGRGGRGGGRGGKGPLGPNVLTSPAASKKAPNINLCSICNRGTRQVGKETCLECSLSVSSMQQKMQQKQPGPKSWAKIPMAPMMPPPKPPQSLTAVHSFTVDENDEDVADDVDLTADDDGDDDDQNGAGDGEESEEEGPDYEPVEKRSKRVPTPPKAKETPKTAAKQATKPTPKQATKPTPKQTAKQTPKQAPKQQAETKKKPANGKDASKTAKKKDVEPEPELLELSDDDDDILGVTIVKKTTTKSKSANNDGIIVLDDEDDEDEDDIVAGAVKFTVKGAKKNGDDDEDVVPNEADEDVISAAVDILVDNQEDDDESMPPPPPRRAPITANIEEIVPEKYRTLYISFPSTDKSINNDSLFTLFAQFGDIEDLVVDGVPSRAKTCDGLIVFQKFYAVDACVKAKPLKIDDSTIDIRRTEEKPGSNFHLTKIHVSGIYHLSSEDLERYFNTFGQVKEVNVLSNRGFAFVEFAESDAVEKTVLQQYHPIDGLVLEIQRARIMRPEDRKNRRPRDPRAPPPKPKFDHGPISRSEGANICVTPFPRHVEIKPKKDDGEPIPFDRAASASTVSTKREVKSEIKDEK